VDILKITLIQASMVWENKAANLEHFSRLIWQIGETNIILLPEMFTTGFTMNAEKMGETMDGETVCWMKQMAKEKNAAIAGSAIISDNDQTLNRLLWAAPDGDVQFYDKRHLFSMGNEHLNFSRGYRKLIVEYKGWRICPLICYDLRFPVWSRNAENYDLLVYAANWPASRRLVWENLLVARAIENQAYCIGVNRTGADGMGVSYSGGSALVDPKGVASFLGENEEIRAFEISRSFLNEFRKKFPVLSDRDSFEIADHD